MNENNMLLVVFLLSFLLVPPVVFAEEPAPQNLSQAPVNKNSPNAVVTKITAASEELKNLKKQIQAEPIKPEEVKTKNKGRFNPTETISEDLSVSFPTDI